MSRLTEKDASRPRFAGAFARLLLAMALYACAFASVAWCAQSLVPAGEGVSEAEARLLLARLYAASPATLPLALEQYGRLLRSRPEDPALLTEAGDVRLRLGQYPEALALFRKAVASGRAKTAAYAGLGDALFFSGDAAGALAAYEKALATTHADRSLRLRLAGGLLGLRRYAEAHALLEDLVREDPDDPRPGAMLVETLIGLGKGEEAAGLAERLSAARPGDPKQLLALADAYAFMGRAAACRDVLERLAALGEKSEETLTGYAGKLNVWGDFYASEDAWRAALAEEPGDGKAALGLAGTLANAQRYEEARGVYDDVLLKNPGDEDALAGLAETRLREKDPQAALEALGPLLAKHPANRKGLALRERAYRDAGRLDEALADARQLADDPQAGPDDLVRLGELLLRMGRVEEARTVLARALDQRPDTPEGRYLLEKAQGRSGEALAGVLRDLAQKGPRGARDLAAYGDLFARQGDLPAAIALYRAALERDPRYFPAKMSLTEALASAGAYDQALAVVDELAGEFPGASKIALTRARILAYAKRYQEALDAYERLSATRPEDPVPVKEMARTAMWGKMPEQADAAYGRMAARRIDPAALETLESLAAALPDAGLGKAIARLLGEAGRGAIYPACQEVADAFAAAGDKLSGERAAAARQALARIAPDCEIAKAAVMEHRAKSLGYARRFAAARKANEKLLEFQPGNQEALFDKAQAECALGLPDEAAKTYARLLGIDPLHALASTALSRVEAGAAPELRTGYSVWDENGKQGRLSQITRQRIDAELTWPLQKGRFYASLAQHLYIESPKAPSESTGSSTQTIDAASASKPVGMPSRAGTYLAQGQTLGLGGRINEYFRTDASFTNKIYADPRLGGRVMGLFRLEADLSGHARLGGGFERTEEIYNDVALFDAIMANALFADLYAPLTRRLELSGRCALRWYSDGNEQIHLKTDLGVTILEHPTLLKLVLTGEYRQTRELTDFIYQDDVLTGITHPYWTPQDYFFGSAALQWRHDLSRDFFCGARQHYYGVRLAGGTDTDENPFARVEAEYHFDMNDHFALDAKGLLHRSQNWDATGAWLNFMYRF